MLMRRFVGWLLLYSARSALLFSPVSALLTLHLLPETAEKSDRLVVMLG